MNQHRLHSSSRRLGVALFFFLVCCLLFGAQRGAAGAQTDQPGDPTIAIPWTADELGLARPTADEVRAAVEQLPDGEPRAAGPLPRAAYSDATNDLLRKWLTPVDDGEGLSVSGGVMQADVPTQALGLPTSFRWQSVTFDRETYNLALFDAVPNSSTATFNGTSAAVSDSTSTSIPAYADLTQVSINSNGSSTRWQLTSRGAHPAWPTSNRLGYNNNFANGPVSLTHFIGPTPFTRSGWHWSLYDQASFLPGWDDDLDIISVGVDPAPNQSIRFSARVDGGLMSSYGATATWPRFEWYIDADNNAATGNNFTFAYQHGTDLFRYDLLGIDAIASAFYDPDSGRWVGMLRKKVSTEWQTLDVGVPSLSADTVSIDFTEAAAGLRSTFRWGLISSFDIRRGGVDYYGRVDVAPNSGMKAESLPVSPEQVLAERYAPILMLADDKELYPTTIEYTVAESVLRDKSGKLLSANPTVADLLNHKNDGSYLDFFGSNATATINHWHNGNQNVRPPVIYARIKPIDGTNITVIQYWFQYFYSGYAYTKGCSLPGVLCLTGNNHEGDWEMIQVVLQNDVPQYAVYAQHEVSTKRLWQHVEKGGERAENPVVHVAYGSHASYFKDSYYKAQLQYLGDTFAEETGRHEAPILAVQLLSGDDNPEWLEFKGYWGYDNEYNFLGISAGGSAAGPRWEHNGTSRRKWLDPLGWGLGAEWDDEYHYGLSHGVFSRAYKVTISGEKSSLANLQLKKILGPVVLDKNTNTIDPSGVKAEFMINCEADGRQTLLVHKGDKPALTQIIITNTSTEENCPSSLRDGDAAAETIRLTIDLNLPQTGMEMIVTAQYVDVEISPDGEATIDLDSVDLALEIDQDGDGVIDQTVAPTYTEMEPADMTPPDAITDLAFDDGGLRWTAPADDGPSGRASAYQVRFAEFPITNTTWEFAEPYFHDLAPGAPGTQEILPLSGIPSGEYFFAVRSTDEAYNASTLSNTVGGQIVGSDDGFNAFVTIILR